MGWMDTYQYGGNIKKIDSVLTANKDKLGWIDRLYEKNGENIQVEGFEGRSTHLMSQYDNWAVPQVTRGESGKLEYFENPNNEYIKNHGIKFPSNEEALNFTQHYKEGTDVLKYQRGGKIKKKESTLGSDTYTRMMNMVSTFGTSAIGDVVEGISPIAADWLEKYSGGMIPHTSEEMMAANRGSGSNKLKQAGDAANSVSLGVATVGLGKYAMPYISKSLKKIKASKASKEFKKLPFNHPNTKSTSGPLSKEMEPYLSKYEKPISREQEIFESFLSPQNQDKKIIGRTVFLDKKGNKISKPKDFQKGGVIEDDRGQWAHPGKVTKINSNSITMKGVNYPVLGISNTGDEQLMMPGEDYKFDGESVTEYPMAQDGKTLKAMMDRTVANREANETPTNTKIGMYMDEQSKTYRLMNEKEKYYHPKVEKDITTGDWKQDLLYKNQWLMDLPVIGNKIKDRAKDMAKLDATSSRDAFDVRMVSEGVKGVYEGGVNKREEEWRAKYDNEGNAIKYKENNSPTLVNQYFSKEALYPTSKYKPTSDYLEFLPSYSVKGDFEDRLNEPVTDKYSSNDWTNSDLFSLVIDFDAQYGINSNNKLDKGESYGKDGDRRWKDFIKNKKPIYRQHYRSGSLSEMLDVNLASHKTGLAWDKEVDLPYMSISDAWDFSPDHYSKKWGVQGRGTGMWGGSEEKRQLTKIQSALMHKAGNPFKVYDRFYFDPKTKKYVTDKKIDSIRGVTKDKQWLDKY